MRTTWPLTSRLTRRFVRADLAAMSESTKWSASTWPQPPVGLVDDLDVRLLAREILARPMASSSATRCCCRSRCATTWPSTRRFDRGRHRPGSRVVAAGDLEVEDSRVSIVNVRRDDRARSVAVAAGLPKRVQHAATELARPSSPRCGVVPAKSPVGVQLP